MFYEQNQIEPNLTCDKCENRYDIPKLLPCGESICEDCITIFKSSVDLNNQFECSLCNESHCLPRNGQFPTNKKLLNILKQEPNEITRTELIETLKSNLNSCEKNVYELKSVIKTNGIDKVESTCQDLRTKVYIETELVIESLHKLTDELIEKITNFEKDCVGRLKENKLNNSTLEEIFTEFERFSSKWRLYLQQSKVDESIVKQANSSLMKLKSKIELESLKVDDLLFNHVECEFVKSSKPLCRNLIGDIRLLERSHKKYRASASIECIGNLNTHQGGVISLACLNDGMICSGSVENTSIAVWKPFVDNDPTMQFVKNLNGHTDFVWALTVLNNGNLCSGSGDGSIKIWNVETGDVIRTITGHRSGYAIMALTVLKSGYLCSGSGDQTIKIWNAEVSDDLVKNLKGHTNGVMALIVLQKGLLCSGSGDHTIKIWNTELGVVIRTLTGHTRGVMALAVLNTGELCSGSGDHTIRVWDVSNGDVVRVLDEHLSDVMALTVLDNGDLCSGSTDDTIKIWNVNFDKAVKTLHGHAGSVMSLGVLNNGFLCSGSSDKAIRIWN